MTNLCSSFAVMFFVAFAKGLEKSCDRILWPSFESDYEINKKKSKNKYISDIFTCKGGATCKAGASTKRHNVKQFYCYGTMKKKSVAIKCFDFFSQWTIKNRRLWISGFIKVWRKRTKKFQKKNYRRRLWSLWFGRDAIILKLPVLWNIYD